MVVFGEDYVLEFCGGTTQKCDKENESGGGVRSNQFIGCALVVKKLYFINSLNPWATVSLSEIKSYVVVLSFHIKIMKRRTLQACSFKT